ncbi:MAG: nucleotidyltransferase family protein [Clostridia bacterium]|nr:nucleotidyltransferase family protein [Clostridia bacterium]
MKENQKQAVMGLLTAAVNDMVPSRSLVENLGEEDFLEIYRFAKKQDLVHLIGYALRQCEDLPLGETKAKFDKAVYVSVFRQQKFENALVLLRKIFNDNRIPFIPLKGTVLRKFYPYPWMRTSCDIDLLVRQEDLDKALNACKTSAECSDFVNGSHDVGFVLGQGVHVEIHFSLIEEGRINEAEKMLFSVWEHATALPGSYEYVLTDEMFYYYHLAHTAKHVEGGGCGVRPFLDLYVLNRFLPDNREKRNNLLEKGGLSRFAAPAESLCGYWFEGKNADKITLALEKYIFEAGLYGDLEHYVAVKNIQKKGKLSYFVYRVFMPYSHLVLLYPHLKGRKYLTPFYQIRRWLKLLRPKTLERSVIELKKNTGLQEEKVKEIKELFEQIGITTDEK